MRRCHEGDQDDLGAAHPCFQCLGPHGRRGLRQVEEWHEQVERTEIEVKIKF